MTVKDKPITNKTLFITWIILFCLDIWGSLKSHISLPLEFNNSDKICHMGMYLLLAFGPFLFLKKESLSAYLVIFSMFVGIFLECAQFFIPFREFSLYDMIANELGILLGIVLGAKAHRLLIKKE